MAMTVAQQKDAYQFFIIAFGAAPGIVYMDQLNDAYASGMKTSQIVNVYTTKPQFTALYPNFLSSTEFATSLINNVVKNSASNAAKAEAVADIVGALNSGMTRGDVIFNVFSNLSKLPVTDAKWGGTVALFNNQVAVAEYYTETLLGNSTDIAALQTVVSGVTATSDVSSPAAIAALLAGPVAPAVTLFSLTTGLDTGAAFTSAVAGTIFTANIVDNTNTFQSGDTLVGTGAGNVLNADLGNSANFAILASTKGIQTVSITAEAQANGGAATNNVQGLPVQINALRMANVDHWTDMQSRADVVIENISLPNGNTSSDVTSAVTFTMRDTQPGSIATSGGGTNALTTGPSLRAYFDPQALKTSSTAATSTVDVSLMNLGPTSKSATPLADNVYTGFTVIKAGVPVKFSFSVADIAAIKAAPLATNQAVVAAAIKDAVAAYNTANGTNYTATDSATPWVANNTVVGNNVPEIGAPVTIALAGATLTAGKFINDGGDDVPANYAIGNYQNPTPVAGSTALITSNLIVDNVGQGGFPQFHAYSGSTEGSGGDIIIGSMASSGGVQQFNVDVQRTSWNNSLQTTNNVLQVLNIVSDATLSPTTGGQGYAIGAEIVTSANNMVEWTAPGAFVGTNGLRDVQTINATGFNGSLLLGEKIDYQAFAKYLEGATRPVDFSITLGNQSNGVATPVGVTAVVPGMAAPFNSVNLAIDSAVAASGNFRETITGGTGNDFVQLRTDASINGVAGNVSANWVKSVTDLKNIVVNVGAGNDLVKFDGAGYASINGGLGNDAYYIDNTGVGVALGSSSVTKAVWVGNAGVTTTFTPTPTAVVTTEGTGAIAQRETTYWTGANSATVGPVGGSPLSNNVITEIVSTSGTDTQGITIVATSIGDVVPVPVTSQQIAAAVQKVFNDYVTNFSTGAPAAVVPAAGSGYTVTGTGWTGAAGANVLTETFTDANGNTVTVTLGSDYIVGSLVGGVYVQSPIDQAQGSNALTNATAGATTVYGSGPVTNVIGTLGSNATAEVVQATWSALNGVGSSESIDGYTVTNTAGASFTAAQVALAASGTAIAGLTRTVAVGAPAIGAPAAGSSVTTITYAPGAVLNTVSTATGATIGTIAPTTNSTVSLDAYGNFTTNNAQSSAASHTFTGSGETVTVTFEGYSVTGLINAANSNAATTYTSTDINNAIASAVNNDATMSKLLHVTQGSGGQSLIYSSLVDGIKNAPVLAFAHPGTTGVSTTTTANPNSVADNLALSGYTTVVVANGDTTSTGFGALTGGNSTVVNNSAITDTGGINVIDLSSNDARGFDGASANAVTLSGTGNSIITNYKVGLDTITTTATHGVVLNAVDDAFQATYFGTGASANAGVLKITAATASLLGENATTDVYLGSSLATATRVSIDAVVDAFGFYVIETGGATSIYAVTNVANPSATSTLLATLVGVTPDAAHIQLV